MVGGRPNEWKEDLKYFVIRIDRKLILKEHIEETAKRVSRRD